MNGVRKATIMSDIKLILENFRKKLNEADDFASEDGSYPGDGIIPLFSPEELEELVDLDMPMTEAEKKSKELVVAEREMKAGLVIAAIAMAAGFLDVTLVMLGDRFPEFRKKMNDYIQAIAQESVNRMADAEADLVARQDADYKAAQKEKREAAKEKAREIRAKIKKHVEADEELNRLREEAERLTYLVQTSHRQRKDKGPGIKGLRTPEATEIRKKQKEVFAQFKDRIEIVVVEALKAAEVEDRRYKSRTNYPTDLGGFGDYATNLARKGK
jgi:hypothetical protein